MRRKPFFLSLLALSALLLIAAPASARLLDPEHGGSPNADRIDTLYWVIFGLGLVIWIIVEAALLYSLFKFRARRGAVAAQIRGNTRLEIGWTIGAAVILVVLAVVTFAMLPGIRNPENSGPNGYSGALLAASPVKKLPPNGKSLNICVNGQQYIWRYTYATDCSKTTATDPFAYEHMVVPVDTTVTLDITGQDVIHSWWIPKLGGKFDAVPGYVNHTWFKVPASQAGRTFHGQCAELCGRNHADMVADVQAVTPSQFEKWIDRQKQLIQQADQAAAKQRKQFQTSSTSPTP